MPEASSFTRALYGFASDLEPFAGLTATDQAAMLRSWGVDAVFGGYRDADFCQAAHAAGMRVYAEFGCFVGQKWWDQVPSSRPITETGEPLPPFEWYHGVNPANPVVRAGLLAALEELLTAHQVDGVWLDFIRWPCKWESPTPHLVHTSFDPDTVARFAADIGLELPTGDAATVARAILERHGRAWSEWRCKQVTSWVAEARRVLKRIRPDATLGLFGVPWRRADYDGAILTVVGQDFAALGEHVDVFSPMVYHVMCGQPPEWIDKVSAEVRALSGRPVWPIVQAVDEPKPMSAQDYRAALTVATRSAATEGVIVFHLRGVLSGGRLTLTQEIFRSIGENQDAIRLVR